MSSTLGELVAAQAIGVLGGVAIPCEPGKPIPTHLSDMRVDALRCTSDMISSLPDGQLRELLSRMCKGGLAETIQMAISHLRPEPESLAALRVMDRACRVLDSAARAAFLTECENENVLRSITDMNAKYSADVRGEFHELRDAITTTWINPHIDPHADDNDPGVPEPAPAFSWAMPPAVASGAAAAAAAAAVWTPVVEFAYPPLPTHLTSAHGFLQLPRDRA